MSPFVTVAGADRTRGDEKVVIENMMKIVIHLGDENFYIFAASFEYSWQSGK